MAKSTVNGKKIGKGAPQRANTALNCLSVAERERKIDEIITETFAELEDKWNLEAKGKIHKSVMKDLQSDYLVFKANDHITYVDNGKVVKREKGRIVEAKQSSIEQR